MTLFLLAMHVRHVSSHLSPFCSHFFKGNTRSFLNSLHLHLLVQHLEEKNPFIPSQGFNHFSFTLVILALLPPKNQNLETKNEAMATKGKLSSLLYFCKSLFPLQSIPQQTFPEVQNVPLQKFCSKKCKSFGRLFAAESTEFQKCRMFICIIFYSGNFIRQNVDCLQQNLPNSRMFISKIFCRGKFQKKKCKSFSRLFTVESIEFPCRMLICKIFCSRKFHKPKCRSFGRLFTAESAEFQKCRMFVRRIFYSRKFQPTRIFHTEIEGQIVKEVQKLLAARFIKPIQHLRWLSNIVPVKKKNEQIRCSVEFRNLNKTYQNDEFPLPNMDLLIDSAAGNAMFSFMDRFNE